MTRGDLPRLALSVRQPWAWAIVCAGKDIENRSWQAVNHGLRQRGRICIHAAKGMSRDEYECAQDTINHILHSKGLDLRCPPAADLIRAAIVGSAEVVDVVSDSSSPWFFGPRGLVLRDAELWSPIPCIGQLGYFDWRRAEIELPPPAKWMLPKAEPQALPLPAPKPKSPDPDLFGTSAPSSHKSSSEAG